MEFLRDPVWQFIGAAIAFAALWPSIVFFQIQRNRKGMAYKVSSDTPILSIKGKEAKPKVQVLIDGKLVSNARIVTLRVWNSGNVPIKREDYETDSDGKPLPITFVFEQDVEVLGAAVIETTPSGLKAFLRWDSGKVIIEPLLLNSEDAITLNVIVTHFDGKINVDARIAGVKQILRLDKKDEYTSKIL